MAGDHPVVPIGGHRTFLYSYKKYNRGSGRKTNKTNNTSLGLTQSARQGVMQHSTFPVCICSLTLALISSETYTKLLGMPTYPDRSSSLLWTLPHANSSLCCPVSTALSVVRRQLPSSSSFSTSLIGVPFLLPVTSRSQVQTLCLVSRQNRQRVCLLGGPPT